MDWRCGETDRDGQRHTGRHRRRHPLRHIRVRLRCKGVGVVVADRVGYLFLLFYCVVVKLNTIYQNALGVQSGRTNINLEGSVLAKRFLCQGSIDYQDSAYTLCQEQGPG